MWNFHVFFDVALFKPLDSRMPMIWDGDKNVIFIRIFVTGCTGSCQMTTFSATSEENIVIMTILPFQRYQVSLLYNIGFNVVDSVPV